MTERETREFTTPGGRNVVLRNYLTGREANDIKGAMYAALKMNMDDIQTGSVKVSEVPGTFIADQERRALSILLVSIDGNTTDPVDALLDLPSGEYDAVIAEVNKIQNPTKPEKSAQPGSGTSQTA